jgi:class 3 adenylate cyclase
MVHVARRIMVSYDIYARTGIPQTLSVPNKDAAKQIVEDMAEEGYLLTFVELLVAIHRNGFVGRKFRIPKLQDIVEELLEDGYRFDRETGTFVEDAGQRRTQNWGVLQEGAYYHIGFLALDVEGNSELVRRNGSELMDRVYADLRRIIIRIIEKRDGRLWFWEGDGGLIAFYLGDVGTMAVKCGMEIIHELLLYNAMWNPLEGPLRVRLGVHTGQIEYHSDFDEIESSPAIKKVQEIESNHTPANSLTVSSTVFHALDPLLQNCFRLDTDSGDAGYRRYSLAFQEQSAPA